MKTPIPIKAQKDFSHSDKCWNASLPQKKWEVLKTLAKEKRISPVTLLSSAFSEIIKTWNGHSTFSFNLIHVQKSACFLSSNQQSRIDFRTLHYDQLKSNHLIDTAEYFQTQMNSSENCLQFDQLEAFFNFCVDHKNNIAPISLTNFLDISKPEEQEQPCIDEIIFNLSQREGVWIDHQIWEKKGDLYFEWNVYQDIFSDELIESMFNAYCEFLNRLIEFAIKWDVPLLSLIPESQRQIREQVNSTHYSFSEICLHTLFFEQADKLSDEIALIFEGNLWTYQELKNWSLQLAQSLVKQGISSGDYVGILMEKSSEQVAACLAILSIGAIYVPIDSKLPIKRIRTILNESSIQYICDHLLTRHITDSLRENRSELIIVSADENDVESFDQSPPLKGDIESTAYMIYTSGSTGIPKGVLISHEGAVNTILDINRRFDIQSGDKILGLSALSFDLSVYDIFGTFAAGGTLVLPTEEGRRDPEHWVQLIERYQINIWNSVPTLLDLLLKSSQAKVVSHLKTVLLSGDWIPLDLPKGLRTFQPNIRIIAMGGATEASIWSNWYEVQEVDPNWRSIPYGWPLSNQSYHILNSKLQPCPDYVIGDLYIGGIGVAIGYEDPIKTQQSFIYHPETNERIYKTGDLARYWSDGKIEFLGRKDQQVKVSGYRIELGEIEFALKKCKGVQEAIAGTYDGEGGIKRLIAWIIPYQNSCETAQNPQSLRKDLAEILPEYMIPQAIIPLDCFPLSKTGKIDRKNLPIPVVKKESKNLSVGNEEETLLIRFWEKHLQSSNITVDSNFFEIGGNSLTAMRLVEAIRQHFEIKLSVADFYSSPTIEKLLTLISSLQKTVQNQLPNLVSEPGKRFTSFELTDVQQAYWIGRQEILALGGVSAHVYFEIQTDGFRLDKLQETFQVLVQRHDMLRAIVHQDGTQQVLEEVPIYEISRWDLKDKSSDLQQKKLLELRNKLSHQVLTANRWPLFEIHACELTEGLRLLISLDALIFDAQSVLRIMSEWALLAKNEKPDASLLPKLEVTFRDYVECIRSAENSAWYQEGVQYWKERLKQLPSAPMLPVISKFLEQKKPRFQRWEKDLDSVLWKAICQRASQANLSPNSILLTAYSEVLAQWSEQPHFTLNLTLFSRLPIHPQVDQLVGDFTSLILLEYEGHDSLSFQERARRLQNQLGRDLDYGYVSGVRVVREAARDDKTLSVPVVFTSALGLDFGEQDASPLGKMVYNITQTPQVWIDLQVREESGVLKFNWDVVENLFPQGVIDSMFDAFCSILNRLANAQVFWEKPIPPLIPLSQVDVRKSINSTEKSLSHETLHGLFFNTVQSYPQKTALIFQSYSWSYLELSLWTNRLAKGLSKNGVERGHRVAVLMTKGAEQVPSCLAILSLGAAYVPLDPTMPEKRIQKILEQSQIKVACIQPNTLKLAQKLNLVAIDANESAVQKYAVELPDQNVEITDLAYMIYTSGSTGTPKGVLIDHRGAVNTILDINQRFGITADAKVLGLSSLSFDLSVYDIFGTFAAGGTLVLLHEEDRREPQIWAKLIEDHQITVWNSVPALLELLLDSSKPECAVHLKTVFLSGDWIPLHLPERLKKIQPKSRLIAMGGATEASIWSNWFEVNEVDSDWSSIPYGYPLSNQSYCILDHQLQSCPDYVTGDLYIGGIGVAMGYDDPEKTKASFIEHPEWGRIYKTGDIARYWPNGIIEFLGRRDHQVKIAGHRIELGEIEAALNQLDGVKEAVAGAVGDKGGTKRLIAWIVPSQISQNSVKHAAFQSEQIREALEKEVPAYMIPQVIIPLQTLPLSQTGKVDRKQLPLTSVEEKQTTARAASSEEKQLIQLWQDQLKCSQIGLDDHFFRLGGDSLMAVRLVETIRQKLQVDLSVVEFLSTPTIRELSGMLAGKQRQGQLQLPPIISQPEKRFEPFALTDVQQAYWVGQQEGLALSGVATHSYVEIKVEKLELSKLEAAWNELILYHDMLRAVIQNDGTQVVLKEVPYYTIKCWKLKGKSKEERTTRLKEIRDHLSHQMFSCDQWPLFEIQACYLAEGLRLFVSLDNIIFDGRSMQKIFSEWAILAHQEKPDSSTFPPLEITFRDYVESFLAHEESLWYQKGFEYWKERLKTLPLAPQLPTLPQLKNSGQPRFKRIKRVLPKSQWEFIKEKAIEEELSINAILLTAYAEVLSAWSESPHFTINLTLFSRLPAHPQVDELIGDFTSLILLEYDGREKRSFLEQTRLVQKRLWEDLNYGYVSAVQIMREASRQHGKLQSLTMPVVFTSGLGLELGAKDSPRIGQFVDGISQTPQIWIDLQARDEEGSLNFNWDVLEGIFPVGVIEAMFSAYCQILERLSQSGDHWEQFIPPLIPPAQLEVRKRVNATESAFSQKGLHTFFFEKAQSQPEKIALIYRNQTWTYDRLATWVQSLAEALHQKGVRPKDRVAVFMEKHAEQVVSCLAILSLRAAYVPLDPSMPQKRIQKILEQSQITFACVQQDSLKLAEQLGLVPIDTNESLVRTYSQRVPNLEVDITDLAYMIYTSGSTGTPKGVLIDHQGAVNTILDVNQRFEVLSDDKVLGISSLSFDLSVYDIFGTFAAGGTLVLPQEEDRRDPQVWAKLIEDHQITVWNSVPALLELLLDSSKPECAIHLKTVFLSGDWIPLNLPERLKKMQPASRLIAMGGATEASIWSNWFEVNEVDSDWSSIPYGYPLSNQSYFILDSQLQSCPDYVTGDLYIGGLGVAMGYDDPEKTKASFIEHPDWGRIYKTGDIARYWPNGVIEFLGRRDHQVKVAGHRIELGEIEAALNQLDGVKEAIAGVQETSLEVKQLVAWIVQEPDSKKLQSQDVQDSLKDFVLDYMIPQNIIFLEKLPLSNTGKVDRNALRQMTTEMETPISEEDDVLNHTEQNLIQIFKPHLKYPTLNKRSNFFELGASSVTLIRIRQELEESLQIKIPAHAIFAFPTIEKLASFLNQQNSNEKQENTNKSVKRRRNQNRARRRKKSTQSAR